MRPSQKQAWRPLLGVPRALAQGLAPLLSTSWVCLLGFSAPAQPRLWPSEGSRGPGPDLGRWVLSPERRSCKRNPPEMDEGGSRGLTAESHDGP